jgi:hypothetical protein
MKTKQKNYSLLKTTLASLVMLSSQSLSFAEGDVPVPADPTKPAAEKASCQGKNGCCGEGEKCDGKECTGDKATCPHHKGARGAKKAKGEKSGCGANGCGANGCGGKEKPVKAKKAKGNKAPKADVAPVEAPVEAPKQ